MTSAILPLGIQRLHQLGWQPGAWMHDSWWRKLELARWQDVYRRHPACRSSIDQLIIARRGFPAGALPGKLEPQQQVLLELEPRWIPLTIALGVIALSCPDHLMMKSYRQALAAQLGEHACDQLLAIQSNWRGVEGIESSMPLVDAALDAGAGWWARDMHHCIVGQLLTTRLPPASAPVYPVPGNAAQWLLKIARFL
ncbi:MAG: Type III secretion system subunit [Glomeribacter sp. 1016415]|nr:Type III secretion system subunit [Glomeribacter sp. 1016415]